MIAAETPPGPRSSSTRRQPLRDAVPTRISQHCDVTDTVIIYTTINFTDEFRNVSVTLRVGAEWLAGRGGRGRHTLSIEKQT